jgi:hypothetical protein
LAAGAKPPARVLPNLPPSVPMETNLSKFGGNGRRLPVFKLNPNPLANHFGQFPKARSLVIEDVQNLLCRKSAIVKSPSKINPMRLF